MSYNYEKMNGNTGKITFTIPAEDMSAAAQKSFQALRGRFTVPGFRRGKAPRKMIENMYGFNFEEYAVEDIANDNLRKIMKEDSAIEPQSEPVITSADRKDDGSYDVTVEFAVIPDVELGDYLGLDVEVEEEPFDEKSVDSEIERFVRSHMREETIEDRPVMFGDIANIDYAGSVDGVAFKGGTAQGHNLEIGSGSFIPGFEDQVIGMEKDEEKDINVTFPEDYHSKELAGKPAVFHVKVNKITKQELPELNDEFIADTTEFSTLAEYRADVEKKLREAVDSRNENARKNAVFQAAMNNAKCEINPAMVRRVGESMRREMEENLKAEGWNLDTYLSIFGMDRNTYEKYQLPMQARQEILAEVVRTAIVEKENPEVTDEDREKLIEEQAKRRGMTVERLKESFNDETRKAIDLQCKIDAVLKKMVDSATFRPVSDATASDRDEDDEAIEEEQEEKE